MVKNGVRYRSPCFLPPVILGVIWIKKSRLIISYSILGIKRSRFFELMNRYRKDPDNFSIQYNRKTINRKIYQDIETNIIKELNTEKDLIKAKGVSIRL